MVSKKDIAEISGGIILIIIVFFLYNFIEVGAGLFAAVTSALLLYFINFGVIFQNERKYLKNNPYKPAKTRKNFFSRAATGLGGGFNYFFYIGSYDHKKYNTQVWYPETLECIFGNISEILILLIYFWVAVFLYPLIGFYFLLILTIPIIVNIISLKLH